MSKGMKVEDLAEVEPVEQDTTEYLLSAEANREHLFQALNDLEDRSAYIYKSLDEL